MRSTCVFNSKFLALPRQAQDIHDEVLNSFSERYCRQVCCAKECGVCGHPSAACKARPGGSANCCPSIIANANHSCGVHAAPCVLNPAPDSPTIGFAEGARWETVEQYVAAAAAAGESQGQQEEQQLSKLSRKEV
jgi:hypothetical protein